MKNPFNKIKAKIIKTDNEYQVVLREVERLVASDPNLGSKEADRLELFVLLVEDYEKRTFPFDEVNTAEALEFSRLEQGLDHNQ